MAAGKLRFGVAGTNTITDKFLEGAMLDPRFELTAVCSRSLEKAAAFGAKYGGRAKAFSSIAEMAESDCVDAIYIAVPNSLHAEYSTVCIEAGKHVLCEKPAASNAKELRGVLAAARKHGVAFMEAMLPTTSPNFRVIANALPRLGKLRRYFAAYCQYSSRYDKFKQGVAANVFTTTMSGGATMDIGVYTLYPMVALFGMPISLSAQGIVLASGVDGQAAVNIEYPEMNATVIYSKIADSYLPSEIEGEEGNLMMSSINVLRDVEFIPHRVPASGFGEDSARQQIGIALDKSDYYYETKEFIDIVAGGKTHSELNSWDNSLHTLELTDEIRHQLEVEFPADRRYTPDFNLDS